MGLLGRLNWWNQRLIRRDTAHQKQNSPSEFRRCRFEAMEPRRMLSADPLFVGAVYYEADLGSDNAPDAFEVAFEGGSPTTELSSVSIKTAPSIYFDTASGGDGVPLHFGFQLDQQKSIGITSNDILSVSVVDGGRTLDIAVADFHAGDKLAFTIDVDESNGFSDDPLVSGAEFELSTLDVTFADPNFSIARIEPVLDPDDPNVLANLNGTEDGIFWLTYDDNFLGTGLTDKLHVDNFLNPQGHGQSDRTDGAVIGLELTPLPVTISGTVFHDRDMDLVQDSGDAGIPGAELALYYKQDVNDPYEPVLDNNGQPVTTLTDGNGDYSFGVNDGLTLYPGHYRVVESQPTGFDISVGAIPGTVEPGNGQPAGKLAPNDPTNVITDIHIPFGNHDAVNYDFAEANPVEVSGNVHLSDPNGLCIDPGLPGHRPIQNTRIYLVSDQGDVYSTLTDANGNYSFAGSNLVAGTYTVLEVTPNGLFDGDEEVGTVNGAIEGTAGLISQIPLASGGVMQISNIVQPNELNRVDVISQINLQSGERGVQYNFCEHEPGSISGYVFKDLNDNGVRDPGEGPVQQPDQYTALQPVEVRLFNATGNQVGSTMTDSQGFYRFDNLQAGQYTVREVDPNGYFDGKEQVGTINNQQVGNYNRFPDPTGVLRDNDEITGINLGYGQNGVNYNFGEIPPSTLSGFVYHDADNDGVFDPGETPIAGVPVELRVTFAGSNTGVLLTPDHVVDQSLLNSSGRYVVTTGSDGSYAFRGIRGGAIELSGGGVLPANYAVYENAQPAGFADGLDSPGTTGGLSDNSVHVGQPANSPFAQSIITIHSANGAREGDLLFSVPVGIAQASTNNNFGEVQPPPPPPEPPTGTPPVFTSTPPTIVRPAPVARAAPVGGQAGTGAAFYSGAAPVSIIVGSTGVREASQPEFTWHLSIINAGNPRGDEIASLESATWRSASYLSRTDWNADHLRNGRWTIGKDGSDGTVDDEVRDLIFGMEGATPIVGDFNGDGKDEIGVFYQGEWFLDLNSNGEWDAQDLWAKLGGKRDRPVIGDWDADGKDDIGIFGPIWDRDTTAIAHEPGLPDQENATMNRYKNVPPSHDDATSGERLIRHTSRGQTRADLIDHVFRYGDPADVPVAGDWNGDGVSAVGIFRNGRWSLDVDGNGRLSAADVITQFGKPGDIPVTGDFNGDGVDEIGVYRAGKWFIDINGNHELDAADKVFEMGGAEDTPVVGDWNGDGIDEPGLYRPLGRSVADAASR